MRVRGSRFGVAFVAAVVTGVATGAPLSAQEEVHDLRIRLVAHGGVPVPGALVALLATNGETVAEAMTAENGTRVLRAPAGSYRVRVRRIGFRPFTSGHVTLPRTDELLLSVEFTPVVLSAVVVTGETRCARTDADPAFAIVWDEVTKALRATVLSREDVPASVLARTYYNEVLRDGTVLKADTTLVPLRGPRAFAAVNPAALVSAGYVFGTEEAGWELFGLDEKILLSTEFIATHCFRVVRRQDRPGQIGMDFAPVRSRRLPDVAGVLWLDEESAELRELDYRYVNAGLLTTFRSTGYTRFRRVPSGAWLVDEWWLRSPLLERRIRSGRTEGVFAIGRVETGGELVEASMAHPDGVAPQPGATDTPAGGASASQVAETPPRAGADERTHPRPSAALSGRVVDAATRQPLSSAQIVMGADARPAVTGEDGAFSFAGLTAGVHTLSVRRIGYALWQDTVRLREGETQRIEIALGAQAVALAPVAVEADRSYLGGFWERRARFQGYFFTRDDIVARKPNRIVDMARTIPGARIVSIDGQNRGWVITFWRGTVRTLNPNSCIPALFVDGIPTDIPMLGLNEFHPDNVEAIEVYNGPATIPAQFNVTGKGNGGSPLCGVVAVWLRGQP